MSTTRPLQLEVMNIMTFSHTILKIEENIEKLNNKLLYKKKTPEDKCFKVKKEIDNLEFG